MNMTAQQKNCVDFRNSSLLVSAGAGSGKTSTLTKRIISRIADPDDIAEIDDLLIVTFTNAAAKELSEKIEKAVSEYASTDISNKKALRQLAKIKYANISTISSFCYSVVKKHFELLGLPSKIKIADPSESAILKNRVINSIIDEKYDTEEEDSVFYTLVELFSGGKNDDGLISVLSMLHDKIYSFPAPEKWMEAALENYYEICNSDDFLSTRYGKIVRQVIVDTIRSMYLDLELLVKRIENEEVINIYCDSYNKDIDNLKSVLGTAVSGSFEDVCMAVNGFSVTRLASVRNYPDEVYKKSVTQVRDKHMLAFTSMKKRFTLCTGEQIKNAAFDCCNALAGLFSLVLETDKRYSDEKAERGVIDFSDAERYTYKLFVEDYDSVTGSIRISGIADSYRKSFAEIYIDEYQDINPIQDLIFRAITDYNNDGFEKNRFMVGDVKQSIYGFRGARPDLFMNYLNSYVRIGNDESSKEKKEFLSNNFRCSENVVNFTNFVFQNIMHDSYDDNEKLVYSKKEDFKVTSPCELIFVPKREDNKFDYYEDEIKVTAKKIRELVGNPDILGSDGKPYTYGDITILLRSTKNIAERYARYFEMCSIPTRSEVGENFFETAEILLCLCLLNAVDNSFRDIYVTGAMRSEVFMFTDDDLVKIRRLVFPQSDIAQPMWTSVNKVAQSNECDIDLRNKCTRFIETINKYKKLALGVPSDKLIMTMYSDLHLMNIVSGASFNRYTDNAEIRRENLMMLYNLARSYEKKSFRGLSAFLDFIEDKRNGSNTVNSASATNDLNSVRIMSIHHSKGLEFPVCIISNLSKEFNRTDENKPLIVSDTLGIGIRLRDLPSFKSSDSETSMVSYSTPFHGAVRSFESKKMSEEEKRILYVAMTRAKDRLIMISNLPDEKKLLDIRQKKMNNITSYIASANSFSDWILYCAADTKNASCLFEHYSSDAEDCEYNTYNPCFKCSVNKAEELSFYVHSEKIPSDEQDSSEDYELEIERLLKKEYQFQTYTELPSKISVSDIKNGIFDDQKNIAENQPLDIPRFYNPNKPASSAEKGTAMHTFMQYADYSECEKDVESAAKRLLEKRFILPEQFEMLDFKKLSKFFESDIYKQIKGSLSVMRETRFTLSLPYSVFLSDLQCGDETVVIQGVIDCFFVKADGSYTVVDFKTDKVSDMSILRSRYSVQLEHYREAVVKMTGSSNVRTGIYSFELDKYEEFE